MVNYSNLLGLRFCLNKSVLNTKNIHVNLYKEYSYLILNELEGLPYFGVMI